MPVVVKGNTKPPQVTLGVNLSTGTGQTVTDDAAVLCKVSGNGTVWQYNAHAGWLNFPFDLPEEDD